MLLLLAAVLVTAVSVMCILRLNEEALGEEIDTVAAPTPPGVEIEAAKSGAVGPADLSDVGETEKAGRNTSLLSHSGWPGAEVLASEEKRDGEDGALTRVTILQPADLPYPVRMEEKFGWDPGTEELTLLSRREMVASHLLVKNTFRP